MAGLVRATGMGGIEVLQLSNPFPETKRTMFMIWHLRMQCL